MLILLYLKNELSFDDFHRHKDDIYQLVCTRIEQDGSSERFAIAAQVQGPAFKQGIPEIAEYVRVMPGDVVIKDHGQLFNEKVTWVDTAFFTIFSFPIRSGNPAVVLRDYHSMVLSESAAVKYFGTTAATGKQLLLEVGGHFESFVVSGVTQDPPSNSSIRFTILLPYSYYEKLNPDNGWMWVSYPTYFLLSVHTDIAAIRRKMQQIYASRAHEEIDLNNLAGYHNRFEWDLLPMAGMHFRKDYSGTPGASDPVYMYILAGIALFVLVIACINFIHLSVAQALKRSREIGIRKIAGSTQRQLLWQYLGESIAMCCVAALLALLLAVAAFPAFREMTGKSLELPRLVDWKFAIELVFLVLLTALCSGFYPARRLAAFKPADTLRGGPAPGGRNRLVRVLVVVQFGLAIILMTATLFLYAQLNVLITTATGYDAKDLLSFTVPDGVRDRPLMEYYESAFVHEPGVIDAGYQNIGKFGGKTVSNGKTFRAVYARVDDHYLPTMRIVLSQGRNFSASFPSDASGSAVVNESFVREAGVPVPIGATIDYLDIPGWGLRKLTIIGVVKDYHYASLKEPIEPMVLLQDDALPLGKMWVRLRSTDLPKTLVALDKVYHRLDANRPFQYDFADEANRRAYEPERRWRLIIGSGALLTILVACTGLFGFSLFTIQRRKKEIGLRKALGASGWQLFSLMASDFTRPVSVAFVVAVPVSYVLLHRWLEAYPYRVQLSWWRFGLVGLIVLSIALLTVSYHVFRAIRASPAHVLKTS
jgi:putative ABC transport system permease protein